VKRRTLRRGCGFLLAAPLILLLALWAFLPVADREQVEARPFGGASTVPVRWDTAFVPRPVAGTVPPYPGLSKAGSATIHSDAWQSDVHVSKGPLGPNLEVRSRRSGNWLPRQCSTFLFRSDGKLVAMCGGLTGFRIVLIDPASLRMLASYDLPSRPSSFQAAVKLDMGIMFADSSGGAYLFLDDHDRVVFADSRYRVQRLTARQDERGWRFALEKSWDLKSQVPHDCQNYDNWFANGPCDMVTTVMPGPDGRYWWTTRYGLVGTLDPASGAVRKVRLGGEEIQNAVAMDTSAVFVISDHAQYAMAADDKGVPRVRWRWAYDRGSARKVGSINQGSGTTPTLIGEKWIAFSDNADGRINAVVLRRGSLAGGQDRLVCKVPLFDEDASATDNSMIGWGRSIVVENNAGYTNQTSQEDWKGIRGGVTRIDVRADESGCDTVWTSPLVSPSVVPKLASESGIAWFTTFADAGGGEQDWALVGLDFATGREVARIPTGRGGQWNNNWGSIAIATDGTLYQAGNSGLIQVRRRK
jgi:hypothetical protein